MIVMSIDYQNRAVDYPGNNSLRYGSAGDASTNAWNHCDTTLQRGIARVYTNCLLAVSTIIDASDITDTAANFTMGNTLCPAINDIWWAVSPTVYPSKVSQCMSVDPVQWQ